MADLKERLLPPKPASAFNLREAAGRPTASGRHPFQGVDVLEVKKRGQGLKSWIRVDTSGNSQVMEVDKFTMMRRCDLPARDLRLLDPVFVYPSTILGREKAIVVNLEQIRCIITADEVLLLNSLDKYVLQYVIDLQRKLTTTGAGEVGDVGEVWQSDNSDMNQRRGNRNFENLYSNTSPDYLPFEFRALEVALEAACTFLDTQAAELEIEAYPLLDELTSKISTLNLERVRRLKSRLVALTRRVQKVRDEIEQLMDDDGDMAELNFHSLSFVTKKKKNYAMDEEVQKIFSKFDKNGDGKISCSELKEMLSTLGSKTTSEEVKRMMEEIDQNGDGYIDLKEFADFHLSDAGKDNSDELRDAFDLYDLDKNGVISANELHSVMTKLGEKCSLSDCQRMISNVDVDGDGNCNFEEFKKMMTR